MYNFYGHFDDKCILVALDTRRQRGGLELWEEKGNLFDRTAQKFIRSPSHSATLKKCVLRERINKRLQEDRQRQKGEVVASTCSRKTEKCAYNYNLENVPA